MISDINSICRINRKRILGYNGALLKTHFHRRVSSLQVLQRLEDLTELLVDLNQCRTKEITLQFKIRRYKLQKMLG